jgi:Domain of unknown function (DUF4159)
VAVRARRYVLSLTVVALLAVAPPSAPQPSYVDDIAYDGRTVFVRLRWGSGGLSSRAWSAAWNHDYPRAELHLSQIIRELTYLDIRLDGSRILTLDDPELFRYPVAFMWEPGFWALSDAEAAAFRAWLQKGGFAVFEDFDGREQWDNFASQMRRVLPGARLVRLDPDERIFDAFFRIEHIEKIVHPMSGIAPSYYGIFENNDPARRLMVVANFDNDVPEYWEWSGEGLFPFDKTNDAYKLGVNYWIYGITH